MSLAVPPQIEYFRVLRGQTQTGFIVPIQDRRFVSGFRSLGLEVTSGRQRQRLVAHLLHREQHSLQVLAASIKTSSSDATDRSNSACTSETLPGSQVNLFSVVWEVTSPLVA